VAATDAPSQSNRSAAGNGAAPDAPAAAATLRRAGRGSEAAEERAVALLAGRAGRMAAARGASMLFGGFFLHYEISRRWRAIGGERRHFGSQDGRNAL
jgi:hypothetical protein